MADPLAAEVTPLEEQDVDMEGQLDGDDGAAGVDELPGDISELPPRTTFLDYLRSPIIELIVGSGDQRSTLAIHQDLLTKSPYFEQQCAEFASGAPRRISLPDEDIDAMGSVLEYLYMGEYYPKRVGEGREAKLEIDVPTPTIDEDGEMLLRHARIYTLAERFMLPALQSLAHAKIHRTTSTARGEIAYARYIYANTAASDRTARQPIAAFWATRSHVLRHEAEEEFRAMCLEFPQFGFDVLSRVLDQKEKGKTGGVSALGDAGVSVSVVPTPKSGRKRARLSTGADV